MPAIAFGLGSKQKPGQSKTGLAGQKRKQNLLDDEERDEDTRAPSSSVENVTVLGGTEENPDLLSAAKSPKLSNQPSKNGEPIQQYANLSTLHSAKQRAQEASTVDSTMYDYDAVYDTFQAARKKPTEDSKQKGVPKYMTNLLESAKVRKRDQLRAKERLLQQEREAEGDEFADKEKFVTGAYKAQQVEIRRLEEEEAAKEAEEEEKRRKGGGMTSFYKDLLKKDEERSIEISKAAQEAATKEKKPDVQEDGINKERLEKSATQVAAELNARGAKVAINDDGEVVDKRQLLSAGLNVAPKPRSAAAGSSAGMAGDDGGTQGAKMMESRRTAAASSAREAQRERQTRMMAGQLEEIAAQQVQAEADDQKALQEKAKSQKTSSEISSAKERYLARKREQEAQKAKRSET